MVHATLYSCSLMMSVILEWWTKLNLDCYLFFVVIWVHSESFKFVTKSFGPVSWLDHRLIKTTERGCENNNKIFILLSTFPFKTSHFASMIKQSLSESAHQNTRSLTLNDPCSCIIALGSFYNYTGGSINHSSSACKSQSVSVLTFIFLSRS